LFTNQADNHASFIDVNNPVMMSESKVLSTKLQFLIK